ncbi:hypothetical protein K8R30_00495 [archaeon]|nr:hypothetical protein [archaeon]
MEMCRVDAWSSWWRHNDGIYKYENVGIKMKRGQVTIFIIVGILLVASVLGFFFLTEGEGGFLSPSDLSPQEFVKVCVREAVEESIDKILLNGGEIEASKTILYKGEEWNYLCYINESYYPCYNIHPLLELQIEREIEEDIEDELGDCFDKMRESFEDEGFDVDEGAMSYSVDLLPGHVAVNLKKSVELSGETGTRSFEDFGVEIMSPIYDLVRVVREIVNGETEYCHFNYDTYSFVYPEYEIQRADYDYSKIYSVIDRRSGSEFKFAVRSCAFEW